MELYSHIKLYSMLLILHVIYSKVQITAAHDPVINKIHVHTDSYLWNEYFQKHSSRHTVILQNCPTRTLRCLK